MCERRSSGRNIQRWADKRMWIGREAGVGGGERIYTHSLACSGRGSRRVCVGSAAWIWVGSTLNGMEEAIPAGLVSLVSARRWLGEMAGMLGRRAELRMSVFRIVRSTSRSCLGGSRMF